jgi:hypothetical protein
MVKASWWFVSCMQFLGDSQTAVNWAELWTMPLQNRLALGKSYFLFTVKKAKNKA